MLNLSVLFAELKYSFNCLLFLMKFLLIHFFGWKPFVVNALPFNGLPPSLAYLGAVIFLTRSGMLPGYRSRELVIDSLDSAFTLSELEEIRIGV
jgi:hypothetical protein